jgi:hypothetical protein
MEREPQSGPIFVGGAGRSGTTLLRVILDAHPRICCGPELKMLPAICQLYQSVASMRPQLEAYGDTLADVQASFRQLIDGLTANFRRSSGKPRWAEKSPHNAVCMAALGSIYPDAQFIHVIRDGRDVACSLVTMDWTEGSGGAKLDYIKNIASAAGYWRDLIGMVRQQAAQPVLVRRLIEVRYEALVADTEGTMREVLAFLGEAWDPAVLEAHKKDRSHEPRESSTAQATKPVYNSAIGRWKKDMSPGDKAAFKAQAGPLLKQLGYAADDAW